MFIRKKKYLEIIEQKDEFERIATDAIKLNSRIIDINEKLADKLGNIQEMNCQLQQSNAELRGRFQALEEKLDCVIKERDYYCDLLENTNEEAEEDEKGADSSHH